MKTIRTLSVLLLAMLLQSGVSARAAQVYKPVLDIKGKIHDLQFDQELTFVRIQSSGLGFQTTVLFVGTFNHPDWKLRIEDVPITLNEGGGFKTEVILNPGKNVYHFTAEGPDSRSETIEVVVTGEALPNQNLELPKIEKEKRLFVFPGLGVSSIKTTQTTRPDYSTIAATAKISVNYRLVPRKWDLGLSAFGTAYQFSKSSSVSARYLGINSRLGYFLPPITPDLFLSFYAGYYFTTTFVTNDYFGYKNLGGPQIYPAIRKVLSNGHVLSGYFKFSPVSSSFSLLTLSNREIAGGLAYSILLEEQRSLGVTLDYSNIKLDFNRVLMSTTSLTLGLQYGM